MSELWVVGSDVYVGGGFTSADGQTVNRIAKYSNGSWSPLGTGADGSVSAMATDGTNLYIGGYFTSVNGNSGIQYIAKYAIASNTWSAVGTGGPNAFVSAIGIVGTDLYVGGNFTSPGTRFAKFSGGTWSAVGSGLSTYASSITVHNNNVYIAGSFSTANGVTVGGIVRYEPTTNTWNTLGGGVSNPPGGSPFTESIAIMDDRYMYATGNFRNAGSTSNTNFIAKYDIMANEWSALGSGLDTTGRVVVASPTHLYVGGGFTTAGGLTVNHIARYELPASLKTTDDSAVMYQMTQPDESVLVVNRPTVFTDSVKFNGIESMPMVFNAGDDGVPRLVQKRPIIITGTAKGDASGTVTVTWSANDGFAGFTSADSYRVTFSYTRADGVGRFIVITNQTANSFTYRASNASNTSSNTDINYIAVGY